LVKENAEREESFAAGAKLFWFRQTNWTNSPLELDYSGSEKYARAS